MGKFGVLMSLVVLTGLLAADLWAEALPASEASPYQLGDDAVMGDWQADDDSGLCAQVIAWGKGTYTANILPCSDERVPALAVLKGKTDGESVVFVGKGTSGSLKGVSIEAVVTDGEFVGTVKGDEEAQFALKKVVRLSPTLGAQAPEGAVVLFDGSSLDQWEHPVMNPWLLDLQVAMGGQDCVGYMRTVVVSPAKQKAQLEIGSDDGVKAWVNGKLVHGNNASRGVNVGEDKVPVTLAEGDNEILLKIVQGTGGWGACMRVGAVGGGDLQGLAAKKSDGSEASLDSLGGFVLDWEACGPYAVSGKKGKQLFDVAFGPENGESADWKGLPRPSADPEPCKWKLLDNGVMEVRGGGIVSKQKMTDHVLHLEFRTPFMPEETGQGRGNSGVYVQGRYEVQVLDSYGLEGADNECGGIYKVARPRVNMCAPPLQWQTYDIEFKAPRFDKSSGVARLVSHATMAVKHNGVLIHENLELPGITAAGMSTDPAEPEGLYLQDHGNPVQFRNIWVKRLEE